MSSHSPPSTFAQVRARLGTDHRPWIAFALVVAVVSTLGSLHYSIGALVPGLGWTLVPCRLCWYQRILMYPSVVILTYALLTDKSDVYLAVLPLSGLGGIIAAYHSWLQLQPTVTCSLGTCGIVQFRFLGVLTIPNQALLGFVLITLSMVGLRFVANSAS